MRKNSPQFSVNWSKECFVYFKFSKMKLFFISYLRVQFPTSISMPDVKSLKNESVYLLRLTFYIKLQVLCFNSDIFFSPDSILIFYKFTMCA